MYVSRYTCEGQRTNLFDTGPLIYSRRGITDTWATAFSLYVVLGIQIQAITFAQQAFCSLSHLPRSTLAFLKL